MTLPLSSLEYCRDNEVSRPIISFLFNRNALDANRLSQQLQPTRNLIHHALRPRPHAQHGCTPTGNLRPPRIMDDLRAQSEAEGLRLQGLQFFFVLGLQNDFGLAHALPLFQDGVEGGGEGGGEGAVAGEGCVGALGCDFACGCVSAFVIKLRVFRRNW